MPVICQEMSQTEHYHSVRLWPCFKILLFTVRAQAQKQAQTQTGTAYVQR